MLTSQRALSWSAPCAVAFLSLSAISAVRAQTAAPAQGTTTQPAPGAPDTQALLDRIELLEKRINDLESSAVLSEPETRVKKVEVYVDKNGIEYDQPTPGAEKVTTYQRERVFRRQTINEKIEEALAAESEKSVQLGINAGMVVQEVNRTQGEKTDPDPSGHAYALSSADLLFSAKLAQYTSLFADVVGLSGSPPDSEVGGLTLLNGYAARLRAQDQVYLREAWLRTELFNQALALNVGRLDLTAFFDRNAAANDETSQFVSDALVNNPMLGLGSNGAGVAAVYDSKKSWTVRVGVQQSNPDAKNLSESMYTLAEVGYRARPSFLGEGNYRAWYRTDNATGATKSAYGVSLDQKLNPVVTVFARYGDEENSEGVDGRHHDHFYSGGFQFQNKLVLNPLDVWGIGYAHLDLASDEKERLLETYYSLHLSEKLHLSLHLQYATEIATDGAKHGYLVPGVRFQAGL